MRRIVKYLKGFALPVLLAIALLFLQALCDLSLPNYMGNIVNIGIQQGGIADAAPNAMSEKAMQYFQLFMTPAQQKQVQESYTLADKGSFSGTYPRNRDEAVYVLHDDADRAAVSDIFGETTWTFIHTMQSLQKQSGQQAQGVGNEQTDISKMDMEKLYQTAPAIQKLPPSVLEDARQKSKDTQLSMKAQSGTVLVQALYHELGIDTDQMERQYINQEGILMLLLTLASAGAAILAGLFASKIAAGVGRVLRQKLFHRVQAFSHEEFDRFTTSSLITRTTNDIFQVQMIIAMGIRMMCYAVVMAIGGTFMAVQKSVSMTWIVALACILLICLVGMIFAIAMPKFKVVQKLIDKLNLVARENLNGLMVTRAFSNQKFEAARFDKTNTALTNNQRFVNRLMSLMMPCMMFIMNATSVLIIWVGAHQIEQSAMQVGDMMAYMQYAMQIIMSFLSISAIFIMVPRASVSAGRIADVLETVPAIQDPSQPQPFDQTRKGVVTFENVSFRYNGAKEEVLHDISFTAQPGQTTAIIGATGSGKSSLVNLVPRFYDVSAGCVRVDGRDVREVSQHDLRARIGYVPQKGVLLSGTVESNIAYGKQDASAQELRTAAQVAQATEFIDAMPYGMRTEIAQGGTNVSGGQKQRLSIARALAKNPEIFIFDDSFSALDFKTDAALRRALKAHTANATILLVAQRVSTIMDAEQILVLDEGRLVGKGTHQTLLQTCPQYREIAESQLTKEELA